MQGQVYLSVIMVNCTFFWASASILIERNVIVELFIFPRCHCHIEVTKGIRTLGEKQNHFTGNKFNYCTTLQRVLLRVSLQHWSLKAYQEPRGESESRSQVWNSIIVPFLLERVLLQVSLPEGFACGAVYQQAVPFCQGAFMRSCLKCYS